MRVPFNTVFIQYPNAELEPRQRVRVGGVEFGPGVKFSRGVAIGGIDFTQFVERDLEVETDEDVLVIKGIY